MYGSVVKRARLERGLTQLKLAEISGIEQSNISAIETGRRAPSTETLHRLLLSCGYVMVAAAGAREIVLPPPHEASTTNAEPAPMRDISIATRARMLVAALDVAEAIVRSR